MTKLVRQIFAHLPTKLPQGMSAFETWSNDIIEIYDMPNNDSIKFALATAVMHLGSTDAYKPKAFFGRILLKGAASQVAYAIMQDCKNRQEALAKKEAEMKLVEATTQPEALATTNEAQNPA